MNEHTLSPITLYVWPGQWGLPSFDPVCLATVLYLQLTIPGKFHITECNNPDMSPSGQLPFLTHNQSTFTSFPSIVKHITSLEKPGKFDLDSSLTPLEWSQKVAWTSHVESNFGNLIYHTFYSSFPNWEKVIHPGLTSMYALPQRYYVPERIRSSYKPRLDRAGLWNLPEAETPAKGLTIDTNPNEEEKKKTFANAFEREKIQDKAKDILGTYVRLLEGKEFIYQGRVTSFDLILAAHTLLLIVPPFPDTLVKELAEEMYTTLVNHAKRIQNIAFGDNQPAIPISSSRNSLWNLVPSRPKVKPNSTRADQTQEDKEYAKLTWGFFGLVVGSVAAYIAIVGPPIKIVRKTDDYDEEEEEYEEGEDEGLDDLQDLLLEDEV